MRKGLHESLPHAQVDKVLQTYLSALQDKLLISANALAPTLLFAA